MNRRVYPCLAHIPTFHQMPPPNSCASQLRFKYLTVSPSCRLFLDITPVVQNMKSTSILDQIGFTQSKTQNEEFCIPNCNQSVIVPPVSDNT